MAQTGFNLRAEIENRDLCIIAACSAIAGAIENGVVHRDQRDFARWETHARVHFS